MTPREFYSFALDAVPLRADSVEVVGPTERPRQNVKANQLVEIRQPR